MNKLSNQSYMMTLLFVCNYVCISRHTSDGLDIYCLMPCLSQLLRIDMRAPAVRAAVEWLRTIGGGKADAEVMGYVQFKEMVEEMNWGDVTSTEFEESHPALGKVFIPLTKSHFIEQDSL